MTNKPISVPLLPSTGYSGSLMLLFYFSKVFVYHKVYLHFCNSCVKYFKVLEFLSQKVVQTLKCVM